MIGDQHVIIVAGGSGKRMGAEVPKQFLEVAGRTLLDHTLAAFHHYNPNINCVLVLPADHVEQWETIVAKNGCALQYQIAVGGEQRFHSVRNGLALLPSTGIVAIHDGVRPTVSQTTIANAFEQAKIHGAAVPVLPIVPSLRQVQNTSSKAVDRTNFVEVQTPQCFQLEVLHKAYQQQYSPLFTDDASAVEASGHAIVLSKGNRENIKVTSPSDLPIVELFLKSKEFSK